MFRFRYKQILLTFLCIYFAQECYSGIGQYDYQYLNGKIQPDYDSLLQYISNFDEMHLTDQDKEAINDLIIQIPKSSTQNVYQRLQNIDIPYDNSEPTRSELYMDSSEFQNDTRSPGIKLASFLIDLLKSL